MDHPADQSSISFLRHPDNDVIANFRGINNSNLRISRDKIRFWHDIVSWFEPCWTSSDLLYVTINGSPVIPGAHYPAYEHTRFCNCTFPSQLNIDCNAILVDCHGERLQTSLGCHAVCMPDCKLNFIALDCGHLLAQGYDFDIFDVQSRNENFLVFPWRLQNWEPVPYRISMGIEHLLSETRNLSSGIFSRQARSSRENGKLLTATRKGYLTLTSTASYGKFLCNKSVNVTYITRFLNSGIVSLSLEASSMLKKPKLHHGCITILQSFSPPKCGTSGESYPWRVFLQPKESSGSSVH